MRGSSPRMTKKFTVGRREEKMKTTQAAVVALVLALGAPAHGQAVEKKELTLAVGGKTALYYLPLTICERLGYLIQQAEGVFDVAGVFAGMLVLAAFVIGIDFIVTLVERRLLVWRPVAAETRT